MSSAFTEDVAPAPSVPTTEEDTTVVVAPAAAAVADDDKAAADAAATTASSVASPSLPLVQFTRHHLKVLEFNKDRKQQSQDAETFLRKALGTFGKIKKITSIIATAPTSGGLEGVADGAAAADEAIHLGYVIEYKRPRRVQSDPSRQTHYTQMSVPEHILRKVVQGLDARDGEEYVRAKEGYTFLNGTGVFADPKTASRSVARGHVYSGYNRFLVEGRIDKYEGDAAAAAEEDDDEDSDNEAGADDAPFDLYAGIPVVGEANPADGDEEVIKNASSTCPNFGKEAKAAATNYVPSAPAACMFMTLAPLPIPPEHAASIALPTVSPYTIYQLIRHLCVPRKILILGGDQQTSGRGSNGQPIVHKALVELSNNGELAMVCDRMDRTEVELCEEAECPTTVALGEGDEMVLRSSNEYVEALATGKPVDHPPNVRTVIAAKYYVAAAPSMQHEGKGLSVAQNTGRSMTIYTKLPSLFLPPIDVLPGAPTVVSTAEALGPAFERQMTPICPPIGPYNPAVFHAPSMRKYTDQYSQDEVRRHEAWRSWVQARRNGGDIGDGSDEPVLPEVPEPSYDGYDPLCMPGREEDLKQAIRDMRTYILKGRRRYVHPSREIPPNRLTIGAHAVDLLEVPPQPTPEELAVMFGGHSGRYHNSHSMRPNPNPNHGGGARAGTTAAAADVTSPQHHNSTANSNTAVTTTPTLPAGGGPLTITVGGTPINMSTTSPHASLSSFSVTANELVLNTNTNNGSSYQQQQQDGASEYSRYDDQPANKRSRYEHANNGNTHNTNNSSGSGAPTPVVAMGGGGGGLSIKIGGVQIGASPLAQQQQQYHSGGNDGPMATLLPDIGSSSDVGGFSDLLNQQEGGQYHTTNNTNKQFSSGNGNGNGRYTTNNRGDVDGDEQRYGHTNRAADRYDRNDEFLSNRQRAQQQQQRGGGDYDHRRGNHSDYNANRRDDDDEMAGSSSRYHQSSHDDRPRRDSTNDEDRYDRHRSSRRDQQQMGDRRRPRDEPAEEAYVRGSRDDNDDDNNNKKAATNSSSSSRNANANNGKFPSRSVPNAAWEEFYDGTHQRSYFCLRDGATDAVLETTWERPAEMGAAGGASAAGGGGGGARSSSRHQSNAAGGSGTDRHRSAGGDRFSGGSHQQRDSGRYQNDRNAHRGGGGDQGDDYNTSNSNGRGGGRGSGGNFSGQRQQTSGDDRHRDSGGFGGGRLTRPSR